MPSLRWIVALAWIAIAAPSPALADIYVWTDASGGEHFVTSLDGVPEDGRTSAKLFVRERPRAAPEPEPTPEAAVPAPAVAEASDEVPIEERLIDAFAAGVEAADADGDEEVVAAPATVVQTTEVFVEAPERETLIVGGFMPGFPARRPRGRRPEPEPEREDPRGSFVVGPAGPPPIGAAGPPPISP